jgi:type 1 glutamine amidotransferase
MRKRTMLLAAATALVTAVSLGFGAGAMASASNSASGDQANGYTTNGYTDLGSFPEPQVCHGTDPACYHDWGNFDPAKNGYHLLVYTYTNGPRHADLGPALGPGLDPPLTAGNVVQNSLIAMGKAHGFSVDWTEDESVFASPATLFKYNAILFFTSRNVLDDAGETALRVYIEGGGAFIGVHNAFGTNYNWDWFRGLLGGAELYDHAAEQTGTVDVLDPDDASTKGLPKTWTGEDEWYNLVPAPQGVRFLASVDDSTLKQGQRGYYGDPGMGAFHPVTWCQYYDGGKAWLTTLGHDAGDWQTGSTFPGAQYFQQMLLGGIETAMGMTSFCQGPAQHQNGS